MKDELRFIYFNMLPILESGQNIINYMVTKNPPPSTTMEEEGWDPWTLRKKEDVFRNNLGSMQNFIDNLEEV